MDMNDFLLSVGVIVAGATILGVVKMVIDYLKT